MSADWDALRHLLERSGETRVDLTWAELDGVVRGMPQSAIEHSAWWSGDRPHTRAWREAGYKVVDRVPGKMVTFQRVGATAGSAVAQRPGSNRLKDPEQVIVLVSCSKSKGSEPALARELYTSPRFRKARRYAEASGADWFILSAEHGLVAPDAWLAPYDRFLADTSAAYRRAWGEWVVARLELLTGGMAGARVEIHAGRSYVDPLREPLARSGAAVHLPLEGLSQGQQLQWYGAAAPTDRVATYGDDIAPVVDLLSDVMTSTPASDVRELSRDRLAGPGLYAWFVDDEGAGDLSTGLGHTVRAGLVYVGQTGATKWPTGKRSASTLRSRIVSQHLGGRRSSSTLRRTLGAILDEARGRQLDRAELTTWMTAHLSVTPMVVAEGDVIGDLEGRVVKELDAPLNLDHTVRNSLRTRLKDLRVAASGRE